MGPVFDQHGIVRECSHPVQAAHDALAAGGAFDFPVAVTVAAEQEEELDLVVPEVGVGFEQHQAVPEMRGGLRPGALRSRLIGRQPAIAQRLLRERGRQRRRFHEMLGELRRPLLRPLALTLLQRLADAAV